MKKTLDLASAVANTKTAEPVQLTLGELVVAYETAHILSNEGARLRKWTQALGDRMAWTLTCAELQSAQQAMLSAGYEPSTINREMSSIGSLYKWARLKRYSPAGFVSPTTGLGRLPEMARVVEVTAEEIEALKVFAKLEGPAFYAFVCLAVDTGARKSELLERRWGDIDLDRHEITLQTSKTGVPRCLFFTEATGKLLKSIRHPDPFRLVFGGRAGIPMTFRKPWVKVTKAIGRPDLHMHDLRHVVAAGLLRAGATLGVAAQVLGHSPQVLARRYGHLETAALRKAQQDRWSAA